MLKRWESGFFFIGVGKLAQWIRTFVALGGIFFSNTTWQLTSNYNASSKGSANLFSLMWI